MRQKITFQLLWHKDGKNKKCRVLLTFDCLSKNVINGMLIYNSAHFKELHKGTPQFVNF